jgi:hypothetical protein
MKFKHRLSSSLRCILEAAFFHSPLVASSCSCSSRLASNKSCGPPACNLSRKRSRDPSLRARPRRKQGRVRRSRRKGLPGFQERLVFCGELEIARRSRPLAASLRQKSDSSSASRRRSASGSWAAANSRSRRSCSMRAEDRRGHCFLMRSNPLRTFRAVGDLYESAVPPGHKHRGGITNHLRLTPPWRNSLVSSAR